MRLDKFLKVSRVVKRRTVANEVCAQGRVSQNGKTAKPGSVVKIGDILEIAFGNGLTRIKVLSIQETVRKENAKEMYEIMEGKEID